MYGSKYVWLLQILIKVAAKDKCHCAQKENYIGLDIFNFSLNR